jgi:ATP-dependent protease ClpP protease subunit
MPKYKIIALANSDTAELLIYGDIGEDFWAEESNDAKTIVDKLATITASNINVRINSNGGSVIDGIAIYNALKRQSCNISTYIDGVAFSAASLIAMAGDNVIMAANALFMIHAPAMGTGGNAAQLRQDADLLDKYAEAMAQCYVAKCGKPQAEIEALLKDGQDHYYTAEEALAEGFINQIGEAVTINAKAINPRFTPPQAWLAQQQPPRLITMPEPIAATTTVVQDNPTPTAAQPETPIAAHIENERQTAIKSIFAFVPSERTDIHAMLPKMLIDNTKSEAQARAEILAKLGEGVKPVSHSVHVATGETGRERFIANAVNAILVKAGVEKPVAHNDMKGWRLERIAEQCLVQASLATTYDRMGMVAAAFTQSTSDFPVLLENALHKTLLAAYALAPSTWDRFCATGTVSDFRAHPRYRTGSFSNLDSLTELGEFKNKPISDGEKASITASTKGNIINISRQAIINDDMGVFLGLARDLARAAKRTIEADVYALLASNPVLGDGIAMFHASHSNIGTASNVTMIAIDEARQLMAKQMDIGSHDYLDLRPSKWLGGMAQGGNARSVNRAEYDPDTANKLQKPNLVQNLFDDIIDTPRITGNTWYAFASPMDAPCIEVAFLDGMTEPYIEMQQGWNVDGAAYKVRMDYGVAAIDYRGAVLNAGA